MKIKLSKSQWENIGKKAGWYVGAQTENESMYELVNEQKMTPESAAARIVGIKTTDHWEICGRCHGKGTIDNPNLHSTNGPSIEDQAAEDPDFMGEYLGGTYDVSCNECSGSGKVKVSEPIFNNDTQRQQYEEELNDWYKLVQQIVWEKNHQY